MYFVLLLLINILFIFENGFMSMMIKLCLCPTKYNANLVAGVDGGMFIGLLSPSIRSTSCLPSAFADALPGFPVGRTYDISEHVGGT